MERIVIEVTEESAKRWRSSSKNQRKTIATIIEKMLSIDRSHPLRDGLKKHQAQVISQLPEYKMFLNEIGDKAAANGLTQEILNHLLEDDA